MRTTTTRATNAGIDRMPARPRRWRDRAAATFGLTLATTLVPAVAEAAEAHGIDGASLSGWWAIPFVGILLSIAIMPLAVPHFWHHHYGKVAAAWGLAFVVPFAFLRGVGPTGGEVLHTDRKSVV
jgi:hypothetical protein